ncbi:putative transcriptional regulatory protein [Aspergillus novofumigatus IBT 16806]|uniref:C6 transcription factor AlcR n=1 Tax=Aspergillus novofumigatus (strain IBT 16806) TaxID=1392255 RepID=A0A2I1CHC8_ASPN1|nr:C6 transcription factor AlcR [Aspergillus novofumigatus IBT 16806]PKX97004.1 C6 transcription factor AlcR [Aspergillus novofumigatus IBT 16806]
MEPHRRRQHHSCDPCRKGKRAHASTSSGSGSRRVLAESNLNIPCSNCRKYNRECTFNWLVENRAAARGGRKQKSRNGDATSSRSGTDLLDDMLYSSSWLSNSTGNGAWSMQPNAVSIPLRSRGSELDPFTQVPPSNAETSGSAEDSCSSFDYYQQSLSSSGPHSLDETLDLLQQFDGSSPGLSGSHYSSSPGFMIPDNSDGLQTFPADSLYPPGNKDNLFVLSDNISDSYARSMMTQNLIRIYHDSMENALSCWLTEQNCPYNTAVPYTSPSGLSSKAQAAWGPNWTNRICTRVCRLDRAYASVRGRNLSAAEEKMASRALHTAIMAFASQWAQKMPRSNGFSPTSPVAQHERVIRENLWNQARRALENAAGIPSFRIAFANIIFSIGQRPLNVDEDMQLHELLENDSAPLFMEAAVRQLFSIRYKLTRLERQKPKSRSSPEHSNIDLASMDTPSPQTDAFYADPEHQETVNLLFWLVVMFDTLQAAMYQRPLAISDEDSQITSVSPLPSNTKPDNNNNNVDLDGWNLTYTRALKEKQDLWGDFFLHKRSARQGSNPPRWPCSYEEAAEILSDASPVKVLLFRQVTRLQTLVYRGASPERLEEIIQKTLRIYQHWNTTYKQFFQSCNANHDDLPRASSRAMLLADTVKGIDEGRLGLESRREARTAIDFVATLRRDNALAVGAIAQRSLQGRESLSNRTRFYHDAVNEAAFLTEPWTLVLIRCFAKAAYILLDDITPPLSHGYRPDDPSEYARRNCEFCISALWCLGTKSDMAFVAARSLSKLLDRRLGKGGDQFCSVVL